MGGIILNIKNKLLATLLILVFVASAGVVFAEDTAEADELAIDNADELAVDNSDETLALSEEANEPLAAQENEEVLAADSSASTTGADSSKSPKLTVDVEILDKNIKVGDKFRVKVTVKNTGNGPANSVAAGFSFTDLLENPDASFKLVDKGSAAVMSADSGYQINIDYLGAGETEEFVLTFLATESGTKYIFADVASDESEGHQDDATNTTITVGENSDSSNGNVKASAAKTMHATGNPLALLALSLLCIVPYYRRN